jgi:hypothetical protein
MLDWIGRSTHARFKHRRTTGVETSLVGHVVGGTAEDITLRVKQHDRLAALQLLARVLGMLINKTELSGPSGKRPMRRLTNEDC